MDAATLSMLPPKLLAQYLRDPQSLMSQEFIEKGTDTSPVKSPWEGVARMAKGALGGYMAGKLRDEYSQRAKDVASERKNAMMLALGRPAEREQTSEGYIDWNKQDPNYMAAASALASPDNQDMAGNMFTAKINQDQLAAQQAFNQAQQERLFQQQGELQQAGFGQQKELAGMTLSRQQAMQDAMLQRQMELERFKIQNDPQKVLLNRLLEARGGLAQQGQPITKPEIPFISGNAEQNRVDQGIPAMNAEQLQAPVTGGNTSAPPLSQQGIDPLVTFALTGKFPEGSGLTSTGGVVMPPPKLTKFQEETAKEDAQSVSKAREALNLLSSFGTSLNSAATNLEKTPGLKLGPIAGRLSSLAGDPQIKALGSDLNTLALQSRKLLELPASGFSDADRQFLVDVVGGVATQKEGLSSIFAKLKTINQKALQSYHGMLGYAEQHNGLTGYRPPVNVDAGGWSIEEAN